MCYFPDPYVNWEQTCGVPLRENRAILYCSLLYNIFSDVCSVAKFELMV